MYILKIKQNTDKSNVIRKTVILSMNNGGQTQNLNTLRIYWTYLTAFKFESFHREKKIVLEKFNFRITPQFCRGVEEKKVIKRLSRTNRKSFFHILFEQGKTSNGLTSNGLTSNGLTSN